MRRIPHDRGWPPGAILAALLVACGGGGGSTSPSASTPSATVTGVWDLTFVGIPAGAMPAFVLTLRDSAGSVTGALEVAGEAGALALSGTIQSNGAMTLRGSSVVLEVAVDADCRTFAGTYAVMDPGPAVSFAVRGAKRSEGSPPVAGPQPAPTPSGPRVDTFAFALAAGTGGGVTVGPVRVANGPLQVTLDFGGDYVILACVGTETGCLPFGGRPSSRTFNVPADFPPGPIQARVYFNPNVTQPPGDAHGTLRFAYNAP